MKFFSQHLSHNVFITTFFSQRLCHIVLTRSFSQRHTHKVSSHHHSYNVMLTISFSQHHSHNVFLTTSFSQRCPDLFLYTCTYAYCKASFSRDAFGQTKSCANRRTLFRKVRPRFSQCAH